MAVEFAKPVTFNYAYAESSQRGGNMSIAVWHILTLEACRRTGFEYHNMRQCIQKALNFCELRQAESGGFG